MRLLLFVLSLIVSSTALASRPISGDISRSAGRIYLSGSGDDCFRFHIVPANSEADKSVSRLSEGDMLSGTGVYNHKSCEVMVESVEYVGLKKMLGYWHSKNNFITVKDFSTISFYPINLNDLNNQNPIRTGDPINYSYSITPSNGNEWVMFLSDSRGTTFATIEFNRNNAVMKLFDSDTGILTRVLHLSKWGKLK